VDAEVDDKDVHLRVRERVGGGELAEGGGLAHAAAVGGEDVAFQNRHGVRTC